MIDNCKAYSDESENDYSALGFEIGISAVLLAVDIVVIVVVIYIATRVVRLTEGKNKRLIILLAFMILSVIFNMAVQIYALYFKT